MASNSNPLDRLAVYFKPCTKKFVQEDYYNMEDTLTELQKRKERQQQNPLDNLSAFFRPFAKRFEEADCYDDELWASHNPFVNKIEISNSIGITRSGKRESPSSINSSTKKRRVDHLFDDEDQSLPSLSTTIPSSDTSSSESSDDEEDDSDLFSLSELNQEIVQDGDEVESTSTKEVQFDDSIVENLESLSFSDNPKSSTIEKRNWSMVAQLERAKGEEKGKEFSWTLNKVEGRGDQKISVKNGVYKVPMAGFTGKRVHGILDMFDNQTFRVRHRKIITKRVRGANLSDGLNSLLYGFKPTSMLG